jgi:transposase InsO family protein
LAGASIGWRRGLVHGRLARDAFVFASHVRSRRSGGRGFAATIPAFWSAQTSWLLERRDGEGDWPAASTIGDILKRARLVEASRRRRRPLEAPPRVIAAEAANEEWAADFKGWFRTQDQRRIDPLTITDSYTRFLVETRIVAPTVEGAQEGFRRAFATYGLPQAIRCDNGSPFGSNGAGGLTRLSVWWLKLGVEPHFIRPASPQENGRHERMHRTLKAQTSKPPAADVREQQARFDQFRHHYNEERPHEALGQRPPADLYRLRRAPCRSGSKTLGTTPTTRFGGSAPLAKSNGAANSRSSARRWRANSSASPSSTTATTSYAFAAATSGSSTATTTKLSTINPVQTVDDQTG